MENTGTATLEADKGAEVATAPSSEPKAVITLDGHVIGILKRKAEQGEAALKKHIANVALAYGVEAVEVSSAFEAALAAEKARVEAEAKAKRIGEKRTKADAWAEAHLKTFTVPKSIITLMEKARDFGKTLCDADSQVVLSPSFSLNEKGEPVVTLVSSGLSASSAPPRAARDGTISEKSRISPWQAYQDGVKQGDSFRITRLGPGSFRDETRGEVIPKKGFTKWIRSYYGTSATAASLKKYGQL